MNLGVRKLADRFQTFLVGAAVVAIVGLAGVIVLERLCLAAKDHLLALTLTAIIVFALALIFAQRRRPGNARPRVSYDPTSHDAAKQEGWEIPLDALDGLRTVSEAAVRACAWFVLKSSTAVSGQLERAYAEDTGGKLGDSEAQRIVSEFVFLLVHVSDREAFEVLGPEERARFCNMLLAELSTLGRQSPMSAEHPVPAFVQVSDGITVMGLDTDLLNARQHEYASWRKIYPAENEPLTGTLIWEFGKRAATAFPEWPQAQILAPILARSAVISLARLLPKHFRTFLCHDPLFRD